MESFLFAPLVSTQTAPLNPPALQILPRFRPRPAAWPETDLLLQGNGLRWGGAASLRGGAHRKPEPLIACHPSSVPSGCLNNGD